MEKETLATKLSIHSDELKLKYYQTFCNIIREKYNDNTSVLRWVCFPKFIGRKNAFTIEEEEKIYRRCLVEKKPWQEYQDIVKRVVAWYTELLSESKKEKDRIL